MGTAAGVLDRVDELLRSVNVVGRALPAPLVRAPEWAVSAEKAWPPSALTPNPAVYFILHDGGNPGTVVDNQALSKALRALLVNVELLVHLGGQVAPASQQYQDLQRLLERTWERCEWLLRWPDNFERATTDWYLARNFRSTSVRPLRGKKGENRLVLEARFEAVFDSTTGG